MTAYPAWTPASRPGIVPLHPFGFGMILGRSFTALRHNPRVLLGFALGVQTVAYIVLSAAIAGAAIASFSRLDTLVEGSDDFNAVMAGSIALTAIVALVLGVAASGLSVLVQGVVVAEVAHGVVAEKPTLKVVWRRVRPVVWRLIGYAALTFTAVILVLAVLAGIVVAVSFALLPVGILLGLLLALGCVPLYLWLATKLFLVPSVIILEGTGIRAGIARSWRLTRGRFWSTLGVLVIISVAFSVVAQIISFPLSFGASFLSTLLAPTGAPEPGAIAGFIVVQLLGQAGILLVQCIALVVQSTSAVLVYVDARMRTEGLDQDLAAYVEARDAGADDLPDPYRVGVGRSIAPLQPWGAPPPGGAPAAWGPPAAAPYGAPAGVPYGAAPAAPPYAVAPATPPYGVPPTAQPYASAPAAPPAPPAPAQNAAPTAPPYGAPPPAAPSGAVPPPPPTPPTDGAPDTTSRENTSTDATGTSSTSTPSTTTWAAPGSRPDDA
ncbi:glycerophosphoryl diester phosphodiesterase membrane domain-containing protein [Microbacterium testaceum]|uniref:glycerophosphoryl diester phosphodiesterase membrane domain-containing protein n=1 Tax=Microbacterium testaceum TaxID=2033 RepID=UPI0034316ED2